MKSSARIIAISGICAAISCVAMLLTSLVPYVTLIFGVAAAVATVAPLLIDGNNLVYSLLVYAASLAIGAISGVFIGNIVAVAPVVTFGVPFAIVKVWSESFRITAQAQHTETLEAPFEGEADAEVVRIELKGKRRVHPVVKWVLYYVLMEVGIALTLTVTWALTPAVLERFSSVKWLFWLTLGAAQLAVPMYDLLLRGCLIAAQKVIRKVVK